MYACLFEMSVNGDRYRDGWKITIGYRFFITHMIPYFPKCLLKQFQTEKDYDKTVQNLFFFSNMAFFGQVLTNRSRINIYINIYLR